MLKRILLDILLVLLGLGIACLIIQLTAIPEKHYQGISILLGFVGLAMGERKFLWTWIVNIYRAAKILIEQEQNLGSFVKPYIWDIDLYPDRIKPSNEVDYIVVALSWDNRTYKRVKVHNIKGTLSINGSKPPDNFPSFIRDVSLKELERSSNPQPINVTIARDALRIVQDIRQKGYGKINIGFDITAIANGNSMSYSIVHTTKYVG